VAERLAVNPKTIRYYESIGLIPEPARTKSAYRDYREEDYKRIRFIKTARRLDLSIDEIREILALTDRKQAPCGHIREVLALKARELNERITEMIQLRDELLDIEKSVPVSLGNSDSLCPLTETPGSTHIELDPIDVVGVDRARRLVVSALRGVWRQVRRQEVSQDLQLIDQRWRSAL